MYKELLLTVFSLLYAFCVHGQTIVSGYVYHDANENRQRDEGEKGLEQISVSNGIQIVQTNTEGRYELQAGTDQIIFVIKPAGYRMPLNTYYQPQFYYIHKPVGSPALHFAGVPPTGDFPLSVDFDLILTNEPDNFKVLLLADPQMATEKEMSYFSTDIVNDIQKMPLAAFGLCLGDIVHDDLQLYPAYIRTMARLGIPHYNVIGNHDINLDSPVDSLADETFESNFGPSTYAFNYGNVHFIVLNNIRYPDSVDGKGYRGGLLKDQFTFIDNDLKLVDKGKLIVLAFHIPLLTNQYIPFPETDRKQLFDLLKEFPNTLSLSGHSHLQRQIFHVKEDGWQRQLPHHEFNLGAACGDLYSGELDVRNIPVSTMRDGTPKGYAFVNFKGSEYSIDFKASGYAADYQIRIFHPKVVANDRQTQAKIYANFFMGHKDSKVEYRIDDGKWEPMQYTEAPDPYFVSQLYRWDTADELLGRRPSVPANCTHLWQGQIPTGFSVGLHDIAVRATDLFNRTFMQKSTYRVEIPRL
jgi:3',5'-cyclic AMP phosphodiesterase CpdA